MRSPSLLQAQQPAVGFISAAAAVAAAAAATRTRATMPIRISATELETCEVEDDQHLCGFCRQVFSKQVCVQPPTSVVNVMLPAFADERVAAGAEARMRAALLPSAGVC